MGVVVRQGRRADGRRVRGLRARLARRMDPAPFVTLRLRDSEQTRAIWPHRFELLYKVGGAS